MNFSENKSCNDKKKEKKTDKEKLNRGNGSKKGSWLSRKRQNSSKDIWKDNSRKG